MKANMEQRVPTERLSHDESARQNKTLEQHICSGYFDYFPLPVVVVNPLRQIVFSNRAFCMTMGVESLESFIGLRPGEAMGCTYADIEDTGCGTSDYCRECGALQAVMESIAQCSEAERECQLLLRQSVNGSNARDLRVHSAPWDTENGLYYVVTIRDIGDEKRRRALERIFFHDILNSVGGARSLAEILTEESAGQTKELAEIIHDSLFGLTEEINSHKLLMAIESQEYTKDPITLQGLEIAQNLVSQYCSHLKARDRHIMLDPSSLNLTVKADLALLRRVLVNMIINALEASQANETVTMGLHEEDGMARFWVNNKTVMDPSVQLQVFKRSFTTKGTGRGLGTYSIKLLTETYLGGETGFLSMEGHGTTFWVKLPVSQPE